MANISKMTVGGNTYDLKDETSRTKLTAIENSLGDLSDYPGGQDSIADKLTELGNRIPLPAVTASDNGKVLKVVSGAWAAGEDNAGGSTGLSASVIDETLVIG